MHHDSISLHSPTFVVLLLLPFKLLLLKLHFCDVNIRLGIIPLTFLFIIVDAIRNYHGILLFKALVDEFVLKLADEKQ